MGGDHGSRSENAQNSLICPPFRGRYLAFVPRSRGRTTRRCPALETRDDGFRSPDGVGSPAPTVPRTVPLSPGGGGGASRVEDQEPLLDASPSTPCGPASARVSHRKRQPVPPAMTRIAELFLRAGCRREMYPADTSRRRERARRSVGAHDGLRRRPGCPLFDRRRGGARPPTRLVARPAGAPPDPARRAA